MSQEIKMPELKWWRINGIKICEFFGCDSKKNKKSCPKCALFCEENFKERQQQQEANNASQD